jgi:hypothetical protein
VIHKQFLLDHRKGLAIDTKYGNEYPLVKSGEQLKRRQMKKLGLKLGLKLMTKFFVPLIAVFIVYDSINLIFNQIYSTIESKESVNGYEIIVSLVLIAIAVVAVVVVNYLFSRRIGVSSKSENIPEEARLKRQIEVLEKRLKKIAK